MGRGGFEFAFPPAGSPPGLRGRLPARPLRALPGLHPRQDEIRVRFLGRGVGGSWSAFGSWAGSALWTPGAGGGGSGPVATGTLFLGTLFILKQLLGIPFAGYATFAWRPSFGFNRTTLKTFLLDRLKGNLSGGCSSAGPWWPCSFGCLRAWASGAWLWAWGTVTAFSLFLQFVAPTLIMPLFNKFTPAARGGTARGDLRPGETVGLPPHQPVRDRRVPPVLQGQRFFHGVREKQAHRPF
jgi:hypothetical protein